MFSFKEAQVRFYKIFQDQFNDDNAIMRAVNARASVT